MSWKPEWVAVGISVLALAGSAGGIYYQHQQLSIAQEEWRSARGSIESEAYLSTYNEEWKRYPPKSNIPEAELNAPVQLYAIVTITNSGAAATAIKEVGIWKGPGERLPVQADCPATAESDGRIVTCELPVKVPEFEVTKFYLPLSSRLKTDLQCNSHIRDSGISVYVERIDGEVTTTPTEATVGSAAYCPEFNPPEQGQS